MAEVRIEQRRYVDWPYVIGLVLLPMVIVLLLFGLKQIQELSRFDPAYFTADYLERYETPGSVAIDLERALREGDEQLMAELVATRRGPAPLRPRPSLVYIFLLGVDGKYFQYLYLNTSDYNRVIQYVKQHRGRYLTIEPGPYFYVDSGRWSAVAAPIAATWWSLLAVHTAATYAYRRMAAARQRMFEG